jgi:hypothetical protein
MYRLTLLAALALITAACHGANSPPENREIVAALDHEAIDQLIGGDYPHALDSRNWEAYAGNFTDDGEVMLAGRSARGREDIIAFVSAVGDGERVMHVITNLSYTISGDTATGQAYWQDVGIVNGGVGILVAGHYEDALRKVGGAWKISRRSIVVDFIPPR